MANNTVEVKFNTIQVSSITSSAGIFNGKNIQFGWSAHSKTNTGFGTVSGDKCLIQQNTNIVNDPDFIDTPIDDRDVMWSAPSIAS